MINEQFYLDNCLGTQSDDGPKDEEDHTCLQHQRQCHIVKGF